eukprot:TRINITY_DN33395_c0_g1_i1.p1 TRINITY_DN33395_c0_g1~~TRINITY_DN33395_c0_g1_i1.p1  ORF type:complete len:847 (+),score=122.03 TRINITY_DN33395_c0_g1_i1:97-2637(+)
MAASAAVAEDVPNSTGGEGGLRAEGDSKPNPETPTRSTTSQSVHSVEGHLPVGPVDWCLILIFTAGPNILCMLCFSASGFGLQIYNGAARAIMNLMGDGCVLISILFFCLLYVFDYSKMPACLRFTFAVMQAAIMLAAAVLKSRKYPWTPILFMLLVIPALLGTMRATTCRKSDRRQFYRAVAVATSLAVVIVLTWFLAWMFMWERFWNQTTKDYLANSVPVVYENVYSEEKLSYTTHCVAGVDLEALGFAKDARIDIQSACSYAYTVWWTVWVCPIMSAVSNAIVSAFCWLQVWIEVKGRRAARVLQTVALSLGFLLMSMYFVNVVTGASLQMASALMGFYVAAICALMVWAYLEIGSAQLHDMTMDSFLAKKLLEAWESNWIRAIAVGAINVLLPLFFLLTMTNQKVRRCRGLTTSTDMFTENGRKLATYMADWDWVGILIRICYLGELFWAMNVGFTRITYIFLSWLNNALSGTDFGVICIICFAVGWTMFLLPPVPGASVYLFDGIVLASAAERPGGIGLWPSIAVATFLATGTKLAGCVGQYYIGYFLGKSVKVQQQIAVDSVPTRAVEKILRKRGMPLGKVAVLVGGPDWPVSVTCGILRVSVPQMLLGTLPIVLCAFPISASGAFLTKLGGEEAGVYTMMGSGAMALSLATNGAFSLIAVQQTFQVINRDKQELAEPREEHKAVAELTAKEEAYRKAKARISAWLQLDSGSKGLIITAAALHLIAPFCFVMLSELCFRPFSLGTSEIDGTFEDEGLEGNPLNIIRAPVGWIATGLFFFAVLLHIVFAKIMGSRARTELTRSIAEEPQPAPEAGTDSAPEEPATVVVTESSPQETSIVSA